jgi:hypothetical protein
MNSNIRKGITALLAAVMVVGMLAVAASASISPDTVEAELSPCESITVNKTVEIPELPPRGDVVFAFDLTGSMSGIINTAKANSTDIMDCVDALGVDVNYGVMSYMDYPHTYNSCGYYAGYGSSYWGDYAYGLNQSVTSNRTAVETAINGLTLGGGGDGPQDYTRIFHESYADAANISYRSGSKKILVNFGDNVPHDCNLNENVTNGTWSTGADPGRNETILDADDLDLQTVLGAMNANGVTLIECHTANWITPSGLPVLDYWDYWTGITGGDVYITTSATLVDDVCNAIKDALVVPKVYDLHLEASSGFESWVSTVPAKYDELDPGDIVTFVETIHVPNGTAPGVYTFTVSAVDDKGVSYGDQNVTITVIPPNEPPDVDDARPSMDCLWPPNHKFVDITIEGVTDPDGDDVTITITNITSDEPTASIDGAGGDDKAPDASGVGTDTASLRAERSGNEDGRVYEITFLASDGIAETEGSVFVKVPHDQSGDCVSIDSGQNYDATGLN